MGIPGLLHVLGSKPLRLEYLLRVRTPAPELSIKRNDRDGLVSISTGIDKIDISLDELNFCLEWDEDSPLWVRLKFHFEILKILSAHNLYINNRILD